jgi:hypothetical protein
MNIKLNDVYKFKYNNDDCLNKYHCFDGQLIVKQNTHGKLYLEDTYYIDSVGSRIFTLEKALQEGTLTFFCNLDELEKCKKSDLSYYDNKDIFNLSYQHGYRSAYYKRKGSKKSIEKIKYVNSWIRK